eukprot:gene1634-1003_t
MPPHPPEGLFDRDTSRSSPPGMSALHYASQGNNNNSAHYMNGADQSRSPPEPPNIGDRHSANHRAPQTTRVSSPMARMQNSSFHRRESVPESNIHGSQRNFNRAGDNTNNYNSRHHPMPLAPGPSGRGSASSSGAGGTGPSHLPTSLSDGGDDSRGVPPQRQSVSPSRQSYTIGGSPALNGRRPPPGGRDVAPQRSVGPTPSTSQRSVVPQLSSTSVTPHQSVLGRGRHHSDQNSSSSNPPQRPTPQAPKTISLHSLISQLHVPKDIHQPAQGLALDDIDPGFAKVLVKREMEQQREQLFMYRDEAMLEAYRQRMLLDPVPTTIPTVTPNMIQRIPYALPPTEALDADGCLMAPPYNDMLLGHIRRAAGSSSSDDDDNSSEDSLAAAVVPPVQSVSPASVPPSPGLPFNVSLEDGIDTQLQTSLSAMARKVSLAGGVDTAGNSGSARWQRASGGMRRSPNSSPSRGRSNSGSQQSQLSQQHSLGNGSSFFPNNSTTSHQLVPTPSESSVSGRSRRKEKNIVVGTPLVRNASGQHVPLTPQASTGFPSFQNALEAQQSQSGSARRHIFERHYRYRKRKEADAAAAHDDVVVLETSGASDSSRWPHGGSAEPWERLPSSHPPSAPPTASAALDQQHLLPQTSTGPGQVLCSDFSSSTTSDMGFPPLLDATQRDRRPPLV